MFKSILAMSALASFALPVTGNAASAPIFTAGDLEFSGDLLVDTSSGQKGVGRINHVISNGETVWEAGKSGNYISFSYDITGNNTSLILYNTDDQVYNTNKSYDDHLLGFNNGDVGVIMNGVAIDSTVDTNYFSAGYLNVTTGTGSFASLLDTNSIVAPEGTFDMAYVLSANQYPAGHHADWFYSGSSSFDGNISPVPVPSAIWLFGSVMLGYVGAKKTRAI